jgi:hypothetical protein
MHDTKAKRVMVNRQMLSKLLDDNEAMAKLSPKVQLYTSTSTIRDLRTTKDGNSRSAEVDREVLINLLMDHSRLCAGSTTPCIDRTEVEAIAKARKAEAVE